MKTLSLTLMVAPAYTARRLLFALGLTLLFATALSLVEGRIPPSECPEGDFECTAGGDLGWLLPGATALSLTAAFILHLGIEKGVTSPLLKMFPAEDEAAQRQAFNDEMRDAQDEENLSDAWAGLEAGLLSSGTSEEE